MGYCVLKLGLFFFLLGLMVYNNHPQMSSPSCTNPLSPIHTCDWARWIVTEQLVLYKAHNGTRRISVGGLLSSFQNADMKQGPRGIMGRGLLRDVFLATKPHGRYKEMGGGPFPHCHSPRRYIDKWMYGLMGKKREQARFWVHLSITVILTPLKLMFRKLCSRVLSFIKENLSKKKGGVAMVRQISMCPHIHSKCQIVSETLDQCVTIFLVYGPTELVHYTSYILH